MTKKGFNGTEERSVSQGDILDTSLILILTVFHFQSSVPSMDEHACEFCPPRARECVYERLCEGGLHAPQSDLDSLSSPHGLSLVSLM